MENSSRTHVGDERQVTPLTGNSSRTHVGNERQVATLMRNSSRTNVGDERQVTPFWFLERNFHIIWQAFKIYHQDTLIIFFVESVGII